MPDTSYEFLTRFFQNHLPFTPTPRQVVDFQADLSLVSPYLMEGALIEVREGARGKYLQFRPNEWRPAIFEVYNRKVAEHAQLFPIFHSFETAFRSTVAVTLERHYNHGRWWRGIYEALRRADLATTITSISGVPISKDAAHSIGQIICQIDGDLFQRNVVGGLTNGFQFTECCDLGHISRLIGDHWSVFSPRFVKGTNKLRQADFRAKFTRVRDARNDVYHHKSVARMTDVVASAEELLDYLDFSLEFVFNKVTACTLTRPTFSCTVELRHRTW